MEFWRKVFVEMCFRELLICGWYLKSRDDEVGLVFVRRDRGWGVFVFIGRGSGEISRGD